MIFLSFGEGQRWVLLRCNCPFSRFFSVSPTPRRPSAFSTLTERRPFNAIRISREKFYDLKRMKITSQRHQPSKDTHQPNPKPNKPKSGNCQSLPRSNQPFSVWLAVSWSLFRRLDNLRSLMIPSSFSPTCPVLWMELTCNSSIETCVNRLLWSKWSLSSFEEEYQLKKTRNLKRLAWSSVVALVITKIKLNCSSPETFSPPTACSVCLGSTKIHPRR